MKIIVLSPPRSGSSLVTQLIASAGYQPSLFSNDSFGSHEFNKHGYYEDVAFTLLNDQLIRLYYGMDYSFLYPPELIANKSPANHYEHDVDEKNVLIPNGFIENVEGFTGTNWDVWGITRMIDGGKWEKCYSKHGMATKDEILAQKQRYKKLVESADFNLVLKDPRLALTMPFYDFKGIKVVSIKRKKEDTMKSMQKHYGPRMFTKNLIPKTKYVSNHFNLKVKQMSANEYFSRYENAIQDNLNKYPHLVVDFDDIVNLKEIEKLEDFIGASVDKNICKPK